MSGSWICCQLGAREDYAVARALHRRGKLELLVTDLWIPPRHPLARIKPSLRARFHDDLNAANVVSATSGAISFELSATARRKHDWQRMIARNAWFQAMTIKRLSKLGPSAEQRTLVAYSYAARDILRLAKNRGWRTVLAQIDPGPEEDRIVSQLYEGAPAYRGDLRRPPLEYWSGWSEECALADRVVVNSDWSRRLLLDEGISPAKIKVVPLAYEGKKGCFQRQYPDAFTMTRPLRVLFLGQINLRKGIGPTLDAIRRLERRPIKFIFVGAMQLSIPSELLSHPNIEWVGPVPHEKTTEYYRSADVFLFPTLSDGFGLTQLEAQEWKLPIIASRNCGAVVQDGKTGWLLPDVSPESIADILHKCVDSPQILRTISGNVALADRFSLARISDEWLSIFG